MRVDDITEPQTLDVVVELCIGVFGERPVKSKGYLAWRKIFGIQSSRKEINLSVRIVFDLKPERLDLFIPKIDAEYGLAFLQAWYCCGNTDAGFGNCL